MTSCTQRRDWRTLVAAALVGVALGVSGAALGQTCKTLGPQCDKTFVDTTDAAVLAVAKAGLMADCDIKMFCPGETVTRAQLAVAVANAHHRGFAASLSSDAPAPSDVPLRHPFACWIKDALDISAFTPPGYTELTGAHR
jgi:hypothetical protein